MRTIEYRTAHVPAFLTKLWKLVADPTSDDLISWNVSGASFIIYDEIRFAKEILPMYFKHNNMASFVRQLNMYGFRKLSCLDQGGMHSARHEIEFYHQYFLKEQESLLDLIKRKIPSNRSCEDPKAKPEYVKELISNIKNLQGKQQHSEEGMKNLRRENKLLWQQLTLLNGRYMKQQAMLQQVLPLFVNMVHSSRTMAIKRRQPLMIDDGLLNGDIKEKCRRVEPEYYVEQEDSNLSAPLTPSPGNVSNRGPVIHDVTEMESNKMFADNISCSSNTTKEHDVIVDSPLSSLESSEHTADSPYTDVETMEPLNILNCNFESIQSLAPPPLEVMSPVHMANPSELLVGNMNMSSVSSELGNLSSPFRTVSSANRQCASRPMTSATLNNCSSFQPLANNLPKPFLPDMLDESANQANLLPTNIMAPQQVQDVENVLNWMPSGNSVNEQNIDNWLGQLIRADNVAAGASLPMPTRLGQNMQ